MMSGIEKQRCLGRSLLAFCCRLCLLPAGKFRIFDQDFGMLPGTGLPRLLDMGQCNDAYSALVVATVRKKENICYVYCCACALLHMGQCMTPTVPWW